MEKFNLAAPFRLFALCSVLFFSDAMAGQWKPICIEGGSCTHPASVPGAPGAPVVTKQGALLLYKPLNTPILNLGDYPVWRTFQLSQSGMESYAPEFNAGKPLRFSDTSTIQSSSGKMFRFGGGHVQSWFDPLEEFETTDILGSGWMNTLIGEANGPPVEVNNTLYSGYGTNSGGQIIFVSHDDGNSWTKSFFYGVGDYSYFGRWRYHLAANPENNALWGIQSDSRDSILPTKLWESDSEGSNWWQIDDGSFPQDAQRLVHDPANPLISYVLTNNGLFVSFNRGVSWQTTSMVEPVLSLVFVERDEPLPRVLIVGTGTGVKASVDEGISWANMSNGLLQIPHTVTYAHGMLIASSHAGYFICNLIDCAGDEQALPPEDGAELVDVVEFYNTQLDHYFITASQSDIDFIDQGLAGEGWIHTGESFLAWPAGSYVGASNVCRFYGSFYPGPNSHFFTLSTQDCNALMNQQETTPATKPRWNFEGYAFSLVPPLQDQYEPCSENFIPVYRAYNNGFQKGEDSNHRYVTDRDLLIPLIEKGWSDEGVVFCSPIE